MVPRRGILSIPVPLAVFLPVTSRAAREQRVLLAASCDTAVNNITGVTEATERLSSPRGWWCMRHWSRWQCGCQQQWREATGHRRPEDLFMRGQAPLGPVDRHHLRTWAVMLATSPLLLAATRGRWFAPPSADQSGRPPASQRKVRVVVADDHLIVRAAIVHELERQPDLEVLGTAEDGDTALQLAETLQPDVLVLDLSMPRL